jgi:hypothetical protein
VKGFDIIIKDNFLDENVHKEVHKKIDSYLYFPKTNMIEGVNHIWFSCDADDKIVEIVKNKCEKILHKKLKVRFCSYTMLATVEPMPHCDLCPECDYQVIIYIKGNVNLNKGTGFYLNGDLNTHVGFNENRAIIWHSNTVHTPLNWASDDKSKRFSIIMQMKDVS